MRLDWDPFLREKRFLDDPADLAVGVQVWVHALNGLRMMVRRITVNRPGHIAMTMVKGAWMFRRFSAAWKFREIDGGSRTEVSFSYDCETRLVLLRALTTPVWRQVGGGGE